MPTEPLPDWIHARRAHFGGRLRDLRMTRGWSQEALGMRAGLDRRTISAIETGRSSPILDHVWLIADALGVPLRTLVE